MKTKEKPQRWRFAKDNDGHDFLIKAELYDTFRELLEAAGDWDGTDRNAEDEFYKLFEECRGMGSPYDMDFTDPQWVR